MFGATHGQNISLTKFCCKADETALYLLLTNLAPGTVHQIESTELQSNEILLQYPYMQRQNHQSHLLVSCFLRTSIISAR